MLFQICFSIFFSFWINAVLNVNMVFDKAYRFFGDRMRGVLEITKHFLKIALKEFLYIDAIGLVYEVDYTVLLPWVQPDCLSAHMCVRKRP